MEYRLKIQTQTKPLVETDELTQMLSQRHTLLTRTTRTLGDADWTNDGQNETQARFVDSEGDPDRVKEEDVRFF